MEIESVNGYEIAFPIKPNSLISAVAADGGTITVSFVDAKGVSHHLFIDRRIRTDTRDHLYSEAHPNSPKSRYIGCSPAVIKRLEEVLDSKNKKVEPIAPANRSPATGSR